jgi:LacI family transcriptional regulator, gluconate utilization system Gnt-I transcriptional repressor
MPNPPEPPRSATLHDVARAAGVSVITASRALSTPERLSAATLQRVLQAVEHTGYVPNLLAGGLKSRRSMTVAALVPVISVPQFLPTIQTLNAELDRAGYQLILGQTGYDRARETALLTTMLGRRVDAVVVAGLLGHDAAVQRLRQQGIPVVETWDLTDRPVDMLVGFSHPKVGAAVAGFFLGKGWRHLGVASADDQRAMQRCSSYIAAVRALGRGEVPQAIVKAPSNVGLGREALARLLQQDPRLEAVYCSSDALAEGVMIEARARGIGVPGQLAVCGFGDADFAAHLLPALTTVHIDGAGIGRRAAEMVVARCRGCAVAERIVDVGFGIVERESTRR